MLHAMEKCSIIIPHYGAYGIIKKDSQILLVTKSRGPYQGLLDLPGGTIAGFESSKTALRREIKEETKLTVRKSTMVGFYECTIPLDAHTDMNHRGIIYVIEHFSGTLDSLSQEDVSASGWYSFHDCQQTKLTPFAWQAVTHFLKADFHNDVQSRFSKSNAFSSAK
ncbi:MAG: NUDIX domain-containing protein [Candidatus Babeliales bacterium]